MNAILTWLMAKNHALVTIIMLAVLIMVTVIYFQRQSINSLNNKYETEVKLKNALLDSVHTYKNNENEWVSEKLAIQGTISNLTKMYGQLSSSQKELIDRVKEINKKSDIIAAAQINTNVKIDSLVHAGSVNIDTTNNTIAFSETKNPNLNYNFEVRNVVPAIKNVLPSLFIKSLYLPNTAFVSFQFDKTKGNPVSFSVSNSNEYFKTANIESYVIPTINHDAIQQTGWQKTWTWVKKNGTIILIGGACAVAGHTLL